MGTFKSNPGCVLNCELLSSHGIVDGDFKTPGKILLLQRWNKSTLPLEATNLVSLYCHYVMSEKLGIISSYWVSMDLAL